MPVLVALTSLGGITGPTDRSPGAPPGRNPERRTDLFFPYFVV